MENWRKMSQKVYSELYPDTPRYIVNPMVGYSLKEIRIRPVDSGNIRPTKDVSLKTSLGEIELNISLMSAPMDTVTGYEMARAMFELGGVGIIYRHNDPAVQIEWIKAVFETKPCLIRNPKTVFPHDTLAKVWDILEKDNFSTIPVISERGLLEGIVFTRDIAFQISPERMQERVGKWMLPVEDLKVEKSSTDYKKIKERLLHEPNCSTLPIVDDERIFQGIYFMKDFFNIDPSFFNGNPVVGMAIGVGKDDLERVVAGVLAGASIVVIDSSHGACDAVTNKTKNLVTLREKLGKYFVIVAGNIADPGGYFRLAEAGADVVKVGIGSGSICTTSVVTGAGMPMFMALREINFARMKSKKLGLPSPQFVADGGIDGPGTAVIALAAGANAVMAGNWLVGAQESLSFQRWGKIEKDGKEMVRYRGMASLSAIKERSSYRYSEGKTAPEGVEGLVPFKGPLSTWINKDLEQMKDGFGQAGCVNLSELHEFGNWPPAFTRFTSAGVAFQINPQI